MTQATILVVEDEPSVRELIVETLAGRYEVHAADSAEAGLSWLEAAPCDLILSDLVLPGLQGRDFIPLAHWQCPEAPIIVISAEPASGIHQGAHLSIHAARYLCHTLFAGRRRAGSLAGAARSH